MHPDLDTWPAYRRLISAVILRAVRDARSGNGYASEAASFLLSPACGVLLRELGLRAGEIQDRLAGEFDRRPGGLAGA